MPRTKLTWGIATATLVVLALAASLAGAASLRAPVRARGSELRPDVYGGFSYTHAGNANLYGWSLAGSYPVRGLSAVVDLGGHYGSFAGADLSQHGLFVGVRQTWRFAGVSPFAEGLVGGVRTATHVVAADGSSVSDSSLGWGVVFGGGASYALAPRWSARALIQLRLLHGGGVWDKDPRLSIGVAYRIRR